MWGRVLLLCVVLSGLVVGGVMVAIVMIDAHAKGRPAASPWVVPPVVAGAGVAAFTLVLGLMLHIFAKKNAAEVRQWQACYKAPGPQAQIAPSIPVRRASVPPRDAPRDAPRYFTTSRYGSPLPEDNQ